MLNNASVSSTWNANAKGVLFDVESGELRERGSVRGVRRPRPVAHADESSAEQHVAGEQHAQSVDPAEEAGAAGIVSGNHDRAQPHVAIA